MLQTSQVSNASEQDIDHYQQALRNIGNGTSTVLQKNVYENRTQLSHMVYLITGCLHTS